MGALSRRVVGVAAGLAWAALAGPAWAGCALPEPGKEASLGALVEASAGCLRAGRDEEAGKIFHAYSIRARAVAGAGGDSAMGRRAAADSAQVHRQVGGPANRWLGGDVPKWIGALDWARKWEAASPWTEGDALFAAMGSGPAGKAVALGKARRQTARLADNLAALDRRKFYGVRAEAGLDVREAGFEDLASIARAKALGKARR